MKLFFLPLDKSNTRIKKGAVILFPTLNKRIKLETQSITTYTHAHTHIACSPFPVCFPKQLQETLCHTGHERLFYYGHSLRDKQRDENSTIFK